MRRRVGSASAANVRFNNLGEHLTMWLSINAARKTMQEKFSNTRFCGTSAEIPGAICRKVGFEITALIVTTRTI